MTTQLARAALWYARHGWTVFPLRPYTKEPFDKLGSHCATRDVAQITEWWERWPQANIGLHCGGCNLLALDLDTYKDTYQGDGGLTLADQNTLTNLTAGGGTHLIFAVEDGKRWGNKKGTLPPGVDVRGGGGYIVLPPSQVRYCGEAAAKHGLADGYVGTYAWELGYRPDEIEPAPLPRSIARLLDDARIPDRTAGPPDEFAVAMSLKLVESVLSNLDVAIYPPQVHEKTGRKITLKTCPFAPEDDPHGNDKAAFVIIAPDGHIGAGCLHERCRNRLKAERLGGWQWLIHQRTAEYRTKENA